MTRPFLAARRSTARGFTLVELMVVVVIVAILGGLATYGVRKYILASKTAEATEMIGAIKVAQEAYKADTFAYKDISGVGNLNNLSTFYPRDTVLKREKMSWQSTRTDAIARGWRELGVSAASPVMYIYGCAAGNNGANAAAAGITIANYPPADAAGKPWYLIKAVGDLDGDGDNGTFVATSFTGEIFHDKEEE